MKLILNPEYELYEKDSKVFCDSLQVAGELEKQHAHILRDIEKLLIDIRESNQSKFGEINFIKDIYKDERNRKQPKYFLTRDGFTFLVTSYGGKKATSFKIAYINRFNLMEEFIKSLQVAKLEHPAFTKAIMDSHDEPKHYHFSNESDMINRIVLGMPAKQFKIVNGLGADIKSIRPYLSKSEIENIEMLQRIDIGLLIANICFDDRKRILKQQFEKSSKKLSIY